MPGTWPAPIVGSFAGFAPAENPVLSAIVVLDHPTPIYGGAVAAPVFSTIMPVRPAPLRHPDDGGGDRRGTSVGAVGGTGSIKVPAGATTEGP